MKKISIPTLFVILLLASGAKAEIVYMNCKFNEGWHQKGTKSETVKKSPDVALVWDKEKKVIKSTDRTYEPYFAFKDSFH